FLEQLKDQKQEELKKVEDEIAMIESDLDRVTELARSKSSQHHPAPSSSSSSSSSSNPFGGRGDSDGEDDYGSPFDASSSSRSKRRDRADHPEGGGGFGDDGASSARSQRDMIRAKRHKVLPHMQHLKDSYFNAKNAGHSSTSALGGDSEGDLINISQQLTTLSRFTGVESLATFRYGASAARQSYAGGQISNAVTCIRFRRDDEYVSIAGLAEQIQIFPYLTFLQHGEYSSSLTPIQTLHAGEKIHSTCWDPTQMSHAAAAGASGTISVWDVSACKVTHAYSEHKSRAWSVDYSPLQKQLFASASDDHTVRFWHYTQKESTLRIMLPDVASCVKFNPVLDNLVAVSCSDNDIYYYDIREPSQPVTKLLGHQHSVTKIAWLARNELASQSFDETLKVWNIDKSTSPIRSFRGHQQKKRFTGFAATHGHLATGSEDNSLYIYSTQSSQPLFQHTFNTTLAEDDHGAFVSAACWKQNVDVVIAGNSNGIVQVLGLTK
ncbi:MAG: hypothetical protein Q8P67_21350, partial [archaeon]|nr:hypothetical protein [archaeon]